MKRNSYFVLILACVLFVSCQQDISGTYKAINPSGQLEKELIIIDWDGGRYFERAMIGHHSGAISVLSIFVADAMRSGTFAPTIV